MTEAVSKLGLEVIHVGGLLGAGAILGAAVTLTVTWLVLKMLLKQSLGSQWGELLKGLREENSRLQTRNRLLERELDKCRKELRR